MGEGDPAGPGPARISREAAVHAARRAVHDLVTLSDDASERVEFADDQVVVEFARPLEAGERGPDYEARVTLDARSGEVIEVLGGS